MKKKHLLPIFIALAASISAQELVTNSDEKFSYPQGEKFDKISIENGNVKITGETKGIETTNLKVFNRGKLDILYRNEVDTGGIAIRALKVKDTTPNETMKDIVVLVDKDSKIAIQSFSNKPLDTFKFKKDIGFGYSLVNRASGLVIDSTKPGKTYVIDGEIDSQATAKAIDLSHSSNKRTLEFGENAKFNLVGGYAAIDAEEHNVVFKNKKLSTLKGGSYAINGSRSSNIFFNKGSRTILSGKDGIKTRVGGWVRFGVEKEEGEVPEVKIFSTTAGLSNVNLEGKAKMHIKRHDAFAGVNGSLNLVEGSIIEGNIVAFSKRRKFTLTLDKGTKIFSDEDINLGELITAGDLYVGPRSAYENIDGHAGASDMAARLGKMSSEEIDELLTNDEKLEKSGLDGVSGASYILMDGLKKSKEALKEEIKYLHDQIKSGEIHYSKTEDYHNLELQNGTFTFDGGNIYVRSGEEKPLSHSDLKTTHDSLIISDTATLKKMNAKIVVIPSGDKKTKKANIYDVLVEKKKIGDENFALSDPNITTLKFEDAELGAYVFEGKIKKDIKKLYNIDELFLAKQNDTAYINSLTEQFNSGMDENGKKILTLEDFDGDEFSSKVNEMYNKAFTKFLNDNGYAFKEGFELSATRFNPERHIIDIKTGEQIPFNEAKNLKRLVEENETEVLRDAKISGNYPYSDSDDYVIENIYHSPELAKAISHNKSLKNDFNTLSLVYEGTSRLSKAAQKELYNSINRDKNSIFTMNSIADGIYNNKNLAGKGSKNAWLITGNGRYTNKETKDKLKENIVAGGYDYSINDNTSLGLVLGKTTGDYDGISYGIYGNYKFATLFLSHSHFKKEHKYNETDIGLILGHKFTADNLYIEPKLKGVVRKTDDIKYSTDKMDVKLDKDSSVYTEGSLITGYKNEKFDTYFKYSVGKDMGKKYKVTFNDDLSKEVKGDYVTQSLGVGLNVQLFPSTTLETQIDKEFSKKYRSGVNFKLGIKYTY